MDVIGRQFKKPGRPHAWLLPLWLLWAGGDSAATAEATGSEPSPVHIRFNLIGYRPQDPKVLLAFTREPRDRLFEVETRDGAQVVLRGRLIWDAEPAWGPWTWHTPLDCSVLRKPGEYVVRIGTTRSAPFRVGGDIYRPLGDQLLEFMRQQRCGFNPWLNAVCHQEDGRTAYGPRSPGTELDVRGGWHDAGDLLKYLITSANATAQMLQAFQFAPGSFGDHVDADGRPGPNGTPDVLDEARWGIEWMLKLHPSPTELYHQVADDRDHYGWRLPPDEKADYGWGKGEARVVYAADGRPQGLGKHQSQATGIANLAGRYAAAMALAFRVWRTRPGEDPFAQRCLQAAREVHALGARQEGFQQGNSYGAPYRYNESTWADDMEWGAIELFRATGEPDFLRQAGHYAALTAEDSWMDQDQIRHYEFYPFLNLGHSSLYPLADRAVRRLVSRHYREGLRACQKRSAQSPYGVGVPFIWCSNNLAVALATQGLLYERMTGERGFRRLTRDQVDWLLGRNPWGYSMFMGIPDTGPAPRQVHLMTTQLTGRPLRGGLVDGPVGAAIFRSLKGVQIREPDPLAAFQSELAVFHDDVGDYSSNEPTMDGTASAILLFALLTD